jgi:hypothetical protein
LLMIALVQIFSQCKKPIYRSIAYWTTFYPTFGTSLR